MSREQLAKRDINQFDQRARFDDDTQRPEPLLLWPRGTTRPDKCRDRSSSALERNRLFSSGVEQFRWLILLYLVLWVCTLCTLAAGHRVTTTTTTPTCTHSRSSSTQGLCGRHGHPTAQTTSARREQVHTTQQFSRITQQYTRAFYILVWPISFNLCYVPPPLYPPSKSGDNCVACGETRTRMSPNMALRDRLGRLSSCAAEAVKISRNLRSPFSGKVATTNFTSRVKREEKKKPFISHSFMYHRFNASIPIIRLS